MNKLFNNFWIPALMALFISLSTWSFIVWKHFDEFIPKPHIVTPQEEAIKFWEFRTKEIEGVALQLQLQYETFRKKAEQLQAVENRINAEKIELARIKEDITRSQEALSNRILSVELSEQKNLKMLASTYSNMAPDAAVAIFKEMDDHLIVKIMSFMSAEAIGPIFQSMANSTDKKANWPQRAAKLSEIIRLNQTTQKSAPN